jgi:hypothetical protein
MTGEAEQAKSRTKIICAARIGSNIWLQGLDLNERPSGMSLNAFAPSGRTPRRGALARPEWWRSTLLQVAAIAFLHRIATKSPPGRYARVTVPASRRRHRTIAKKTIAKKRYSAASLISS